MLGEGYLSSYSWDKTLARWNDLSGISLPRTPCLIIVW